MASVPATQSAVKAIALSQNWLRGNLIGELCLTDVLLTILHNRNRDPNYVGLPVDGVQLHARMVTFKNTYQNKLRKVIRKEQWKIICPNSGISSSDDWDITIMKVVIQYEVLHLLPPTKGWENAVDPTDFSTAADVCRAKDVRNQLKHGTIKTLATVADYNIILKKVEDLLLSLGYQNMKLFNDIKTGNLKLYTSQIMKILEDKVNDIDQKVDNISVKVDDISEEFKELQRESIQNKSENDNNLLELDSEVQHIKDVLHEITTSVGDLDRKTQCTINTKIKNVERRLNERIRQNTLRSQRNEERINSLERHIKESDLKDIVLPECLEIISKNIREDWKKLSDLLHLPTEGTSEQQQPHLNMKKCFENAQNLISWKTLKRGLDILERDDLVRKLKDETNLSYELKQLSLELKTSTAKKYASISTFDRNRSTLHVPKRRKREDVVVGLSLIKDAAKAFFQAVEMGDDKIYDDEERMSMMFEVACHRESPRTIQQMRTEFEEVSSIETDYSEIIVSENDYVIISGVPGCGKTTLSETLAYKWSSNEIWLGAPNFQFVFILKFRELSRFKYDENITAEKILAQFFPEQFDETVKIKQKALIILDGFDEFSARNDLLETEDKYTSYTRAIFDLLNPHNRKLPFARLITSRPASCKILFKLIKNQNFTQFRLFEITGFSMDNIRRYVIRYFDSNISEGNESDSNLELSHSNVEAFLSKVENTEILRSTMAIPFYCNAVCCLVEEEISFDSIPMTNTGLFSKLLTVFLRNHGLRNSKLTLIEVLKEESTKQMILMLSKFAFLMQVEGNITFTKSDFTKNFGEQGNFEELIRQTGLILELDTDNEEELRYQFLHYSFHEYLVALYCFHIGSTERISNPYIIAMAFGLTGGLVDQSRSHPYVQRYARMFQSRKVINVYEYVERQTKYRDEFLSLVFEYQNNLNIDTITITDGDYVSHKFAITKCHLEHLTTNALQGNITIKDVTMKAVFGDYPRHNHICWCGELLATLKIASRCVRIVALGGATLYGALSIANERYSSKCSERFWLDKVVFLGDLTGTVNVKDLELYTSEVEYYVTGYDFFPNFEPIETIHNFHLMCQVEFSELPIINKWMELATTLCIEFKKVTISFVKKLEFGCGDGHMCGDFNFGPITPGVIDAAKKIRDNHQIENLIILIAGIP